MCETHRHSGRSQAAVLERPTQPSRGWSSSATLPSHTRATQVTPLPPAKPVYQAPKPQPPAPAKPAFSQPQKQVVAAQPAKTAIAPLDPQLAGQLQELFNEAFNERKTLVAATGGTMSKGAEKRWQNETLERTYRLLFPGEQTRPEQFDGEKKGQTIDKVRAKFREIRIDQTKAPSFMGGNRMS